jgi:glycosyltransferase involved in cell wall biosynthesis
VGRTDPQLGTTQAIARPKLLFLACYFVPVQGSACVRTWNISKYLARLGWDVTVVTPDPSLFRNVDDPERVSMDLDREGIRRILTGHRWRCLSPDELNCWNRGVGWVVGGICRNIAWYLGVTAGVGWIKEAERACASLTANDIDVILATGPPFASFTLAKRLSERLECPYVLDYRDPWIIHQNCRLSALQAMRELERKLIEDCSAVTSVSESLLDGTVGRRPKLHLITNGFDPEEMIQAKPYEFGHFAIVYAGIFYPPKRVITPVMAALRLLKKSETSKGVEWRLHYYGPQGDHVSQEAERFGVLDKVLIHGRVTRMEALSAIRGSAVTVVITSVVEEKAAGDRGTVTGKLFEPLGLGVPVLLIAPSGSDVEAIVQTTGLAHHVTPSNIDGMVSFLRKVMTGETPKAKFPETYAWPNIIKRLNTILRKSIAGSCQN